MVSRVVLRAVVLLLLFGPTTAVGDGPIDPTIPISDAKVALELFATLPATGRRPDARINVLREAPKGDRLLVNDLNGFLYSMDKSSGASTTYLDFLTEFPFLKTSPGLATGLVSFAFHPEFSQNGKLYTIHAEYPHMPTATVTISPPVGDYEQTSVLMEWTADDPAANVFQGTRREILRLGTPGRFHPMGDVSFDPTRSVDAPEYGLLYVSIGDGQSFNFGRLENLQRSDSLLGTILRIDPDPTRQDILASNGQYSIPGSNPWASDGDAETFDEVFAYGFRNPHRLTWDERTGSLLVSEVGENDLEEVNIVHVGSNYGWPNREGSFQLGGLPLPADDDAYGYEYPVAQYDHDEGSAVSNAIVVHDGHSNLDDRLVFGDIVSGRMFVASLREIYAADDGIPATTAEIRELQVYADGKKTSFAEVVSRSMGTRLSRVDLRLGSDASGGLYVMSKQSGEVYRARAISERDCNFDGYLDTNDLQCLCSLDESEQNLVLAELNSVAGDLNLDGVVGFGDFLTLSQNFAANGMMYLEGDLDCNGTVEFADFLQLSANWGRTAEPRLEFVPESHCFFWLILAAWIGLPRNRPDRLKSWRGSSECRGTPPHSEQRNEHFTSPTSPRSHGHILVDHSTNGG